MRSLIAENYVLPERRPELDAALAEAFASGRYDVQESGLLAERINSDLERVGRDGHLNFTYDPRRFEALSAGTAEARPDVSLLEAEVRRRNHGIRQLQVLPGNVRYLDYHDFDWIGDESEAALNAAMAFLEGGDALIIDLRRNGGGNGRAVHQVISHFLDADTPLIRFQRGSEVSPTLTSFEGLTTLRGKPLYVLTGGGTASAAEEFVGHVLGYRLGQVVGERSAGAAYMNRLYPVAPGFVLSVSFARPVLAATESDWERDGLEPTLPSPAEQALDVAHAHALRQLAAAATGPGRTELEALATGIEQLRRPGRPDAPLSAYTGTYGSRRIVLEGDQLWYRHDNRMRRRLAAIAGHEFILVDDPLVRVVFSMSDGRPAALDLRTAAGTTLARHERSE